MSLSSLFVVTNALRLRLFKPSKRLTAAVSQCDASCPIARDETADGTNADGVQVSEQELVTQKEINKEQNIQNNTEQIKEENKMKYQLKVEGMMCMRCVSHVTNALKGVEGVMNVDVNLDKGTADVVANSTVTADSLKAAVEAQDYNVTEVKAI